MVMELVPMLSRQLLLWYVAVTLVIGLKGELNPENNMA